MTDPEWASSMAGLLKRRAEQMAKAPATSEPGDEIEVLRCRLGQERYAVETRHLRAVQWVREITPVPSTPAFVVGIVSVRGEIVTLLDLADMIGLTSEHEHHERGKPALLLGLPGVRSGLVVDEVLGVARLNLTALQPSLSGREFTRGIGPGDTVLLDVEALLASGRFSVSDD